MAGLGGYYGQQSKSDRKRQTLCVITYVRILKNETKLILEKYEQTCREQSSGYQYGEGKEKGQDRGKGYKLLCIK